MVLTRGRWYYEAELLSAGVVQLGACDVRLLLQVGGFIQHSPMVVVCVIVLYVVVG